MAFNSDDAADFLEQNAALRRQGSLLQEALIAAHSSAVAAQHLGSAEYGPLFRQHLRVELDGDRVSVNIVDSRGHKRTRLESGSGRFVKFSDADLASEILAKWPQLKQETGTTKTPTTEAETKGAADAALLARLRAEHEHSGVKPVLTAAHIERAKRANPWSKATLNLTEQMRLEKYSPELAERLKAEAG